MLKLYFIPADATIYLLHRRPNLKKKKHLKSKKKHYTFKQSSQPRRDKQATFENRLIYP